MEATRTLVKSPPELWAEVSDVATLARHLGKFGEIRITRTEPESVVEWEGDRASGTVRLEPAGWGTRVTLTVEPLDPGDAPSPDGSAAVGTGDDAPVDTVAVARGDASLMEVPRVDQPADATGLADDTPTEGVPAEDPVPVAVEAGESVPAVDGGSLETSSPAAEVEPAQIEPSAGPDETADEPARESRRGFFARVFGRWRRRRAAAEAVAAAPAETPEPTVRETPSAAPEETSEPRQLGTPSAPPEESPEQTALETPSVPEAPLDPPQAPPLPPTEAPPVDPPDVPTVDPPQAPPMPPPEAPPLDPQAPPTQSADDAPEQSIAGVDGAAILGQALDALGAHHHRPFSR